MTLLMWCALVTPLVLAGIASLLAARAGRRATKRLRRSL